MNWTVALGLGMWSAACFQDLEIPWPVTTWGVLGLLHVLVPLAEWRRIAPFVLLGWGFGSWNLSSSESGMTFEDTASHCVVPRLQTHLHGFLRQVNATWGVSCQNDSGQGGVVVEYAGHRASHGWTKVDSGDAVTDV